MYSWRLIGRNGGYTR